ncbi:RNA polymerase sigma factor [Pedobacter sp. UBA4863]|uniref:RNA polymerase sigma factor n=1 Tax=Pedobacter sp. UBA4863 TaxID=1947060 RepID=UPI0025DD1F24|nr:RNA polymerase sigma-70 factor [Pedobacter sp. UBA4863]
MAIKPHINEQSLLNLIAKGDERAFKDIFYHYVSPLSNFVQKVTNDVAITEEVVQDTFITIWLKKETISEIENFGGYLYTVCRNNALHALKKIAKTTLVTELLTDDYNDCIAEEIDYIEEFRKLVDLSIQKLPAQQKKVYTLSRYDKLKHQEIAKQLGISIETVKKHIQLATSFLEADLKSQITPSIIFILTTPIIF